MHATWGSRHPGEAAFPGANGKIAFVSNRDGDDEIYVMEPDGTVVTRLTNSPEWDWFPAWSADGTKIAFASYRDGGNPEIYVMNADGSDQTRLTNNSAFDSDPTWSPDGTKIAFTSNRNGDYEVFVMNADGSGATNLTDYPSKNDADPAWSPDGSKIAFWSIRDGFDAIYVMNADGSGQTNLTPSGGGGHDPDWSPDGTMIVYGGVRMGASGTGRTAIFNGQWSAWSPDGTKIAYTGGGGVGPFSLEIYVTNPDGTATTRLTNNDADDKHAAWQPLTPPPTPTPTATPPSGIHLQGDVDCDGVVSAVDALKVLRFVAGLAVVQTEPCPDIGTPRG